MKQDNSVFFKRSDLLPFVEMRKATRSTACYHQHSHDEFSFGIIDQGNALYRNRQTNHSISQGDTVTINPSDVHSCNPAKGKWSYRMLFVDAHWMGEIQSQLFKHNRIDYHPFERQYETSELFYQSFNHLFQSLNQNYEPLTCEVQLVDFLELCFNAQNSMDSLQQNQTYRPCSNMRRIKEMLLDQIGEQLSLEALVSEVGISQYHLIRRFRHYFGMSPHAYLLDARIKKSKQMLRTGCKIVDISNSLGFSDQAHFQRNFKKRIAVTPKRYQSYFL
ncbi:helix-turn-helix transcriptional regulator [Vibrio cortegadensis]|uniref:helix-turn-helix transcriptional regulator n=1 Tax=Vibrio cortegadensis TaxID=1328770 RepID=UPI00352CC53C